MELCKVVYQQTSGFPQEERFGLTSQIRRAAVSVPSNIAEGASRKSPKDFGRFLMVVLGSLYELETQLLLAESIGVLNASVSDSIISQINQLQRMVIAFSQSIERKNPTVG